MQDYNKHLIFGLRDDALHHINEVHSGLACDCLCPSCNSPLIAKKGGVNIHHFAHYNSENCGMGFESAIHYLAKATVEKYKYIEVPSRFILNSAFHYYSESTFKTIHIEHVLLEKRVGSLIPDLIAETSMGRFYIEVVYTNPVTEDKLIKLRKHNCPVLEIDLNNFDMDTLLAKPRTLLNSKEAGKKWLIMPNDSKVVGLFPIITNC